ncbi:MAG: hypothetical protein KUG73_00335 [Pseudomonadales bacterium]|nr:hypothetical protein [Pseudomonadales bacterium]
MASQYTQTIRRLWTLLLILIALILFTCAFLPSHYFRYPYIISQCMDALHFPAGFVLFIIIYLKLPTRKYTAHILLIVASLMFAAVELLQPYAGRTASWGDLGVSLLGVLLAWLWAIGKQKSINFTSFIIISIVAGGSLWLLKPGATATWRAYQIHQLFPAIANFETSAHRLIIPLWRSNVNQIAYNKNRPEDGHYLSYNKRGNRWSGVELKIIQQNWSDRSELCFDAKGPLPSTKLLIRFDDQMSSDSHTSSTQKVAINSSWANYCINIQQLTVNEKRTLDIGNMKKLIFFIDGKLPSKRFSIDNVRVN